MKIIKLLFIEYKAFIVWKLYERIIWAFKSILIKFVIIKINIKEIFILTQSSITEKYFASLTLLTIDFFFYLFQVLTLISVNFVGYV